MILDGSFSGDTSQEYIALDANNIVNISGNIFLYPPQGHPIILTIEPYVW